MGLHWSTPPLSHKSGVPQVMSMGTHNSRHTHKKFFSEEECSWCMATHSTQTKHKHTHHQAHTDHRGGAHMSSICIMSLKSYWYIKPLKLHVMKRFLEILLQSIIIIMIIGFVFTCLFLSVNENEIAIECVTATAYTILPLLLLAVGIDIKLERAS